MKRPIYYLPFLMIMTLVMNACLQTDRVELEKRVIVDYTFEGLNNIYTSESDTINIESVRMFVPRFWIITTSGDSLNSNVPFVFSFSQANLDQTKNIINATVGFTGLEDYNDFRLLVEQFSDESGIVDNTLNDENNPLSFSISGRYNGESFSYGSQYEFDRSISYDEVNLTGKEETMILTLIGDASQWFSDPAQSGEFVDPTDPANTAVIDQQFENSFRISARRTTSAQ